MKLLVHSARFGCLCVLIAGLGVAPAQDTPPPAIEIQDDGNVPDGIEIQTRGPIHEAYAQPNNLKAVPGQLVTKQPPANVPEEPPEARPEGRNVVWIPGYWHWDPERDDFLWVSGVYRDVPEGRRWVPGHWVRVDGGHRWIPGFWASTRQEEIPYTPEPPEPLYNEPNVPAPDLDSTWVPGYWNYNETRFVWRPGYWAPHYAGRVWVTPHYLWTPSGHIFCDGYWDYPFEDRGLLFAPVYFHRPLWHTHGWHYRPWYTVRLGSFFDHCFWRPGSFHFYFGNYYDHHHHHHHGYRPWWHHHHHRWHSVFAHHHWRHHRGDHDWWDRQRDLYDARRNGRHDDLPPRDFRDLRRRLNDNVLVNNRDSRVVAPLTETKLVNKNVNLVKTTSLQKEAFKNQIERYRELQQVRNKVENRGDDVGKRFDAARIKERVALKLPALREGDDGRPFGASKEPRIAAPGKGDRPSLPGGRSDDNAPSFKDGGKKGPPPVVLRPSGKDDGPNLTRPRGNDGPSNLPKALQPRNNNEGPGNLPKVVRPRDDDKPSTPRSFNIPELREKFNLPRATETPRGSDNKPSAPRSLNVPELREKLNTPRVIESPRGSDNKPSTPRSFNIPELREKFNVPRVIESPRGSDNRPSAPRIINPPSESRSERRIEVPPSLRPSQPRIETPRSEGPRFNVPSTPRSSPAQPKFNLPSTPRFNPPSTPRSSPAPKFNPPSAPRMNTPSAPRSTPRFSAPSGSRSFSLPSRSSPSRSSPARSSRGGGSSRSRDR